MTERSQQEVDLSILWRGIRRRIWWILGASTLLSLSAYFWFRSQPPVYAASAVMMSAGTQQNASDPTFGGAVLKAPPLPEGAIQQALQSTLVINPLLNAITKQGTIPASEKERLKTALTRELTAQRLQTLTLDSRIEPYSNGSGLYIITAKARTAEAAAAVANLASQALRNWDTARAQDNLRRAESGYRAQLDQIDQQLAALNQRTGIAYETLIARRSSVQSSLTSAAILADSVTGILSPLSDAIPPTRPESPRPLRSAVLAGLLGLLLSTGLVVLTTLLDRTIRNEDDLLGLNLPTLAIVPRLRQRDIVFSGIVRAARQAGLYEAIGFLRVNLLSALNGKAHPIVMITSTAPGEGKSSITATLADGLAASGQRVLVIDADLRRGTQQEVWKKFDASDQWTQLTGAAGVRTTREALLNPENVQVLAVEPNVHMLPAGPSLHDSLSVFNQADIQRALRTWSQHYDVVLVDSAPLLALADGLVLGRYTDGILMVCEYGRTNVQAIRSAMRRAERGGLNILGAVVNKSDVREDRSYGYSYSYGMKEQAMS